MIRAQLILDEPLADQLRAVSTRSGASMSEIVREALVAYFHAQEPDLTWVGSLSARATASHDLDDIRTSVAAGRRAENPHEYRLGYVERDPLVDGGARDCGYPGASPPG